MFASRPGLLLLGLGARRVKRVKVAEQKATWNSSAFFFALKRNNLKHLASRIYFYRLNSCFLSEGKWICFFCHLKNSGHGELKCSVSVLKPWRLLSSPLKSQPVSAAPVVVFCNLPAGTPRLQYNVGVSSQFLVDTLLSPSFFKGGLGSVK